MRLGVRAAGATLVLSAIVVGGACGKRGAPIPPNVRIPAAVAKIEAARLGNDVYVTLTVPATNIDESMPIDIQRIDVYGYTGRSAPPTARFVELGGVVASIPVVAPPKVDEDAPPPPPPDPSKGAVPGSMVTVMDRLEEDELVQGRVYVDPRAVGSALPPASGDQPLSPLRRFYLAVPFSVRGRPGPPGMQAELALTALPDPPSEVRATYNSSGISLTWDPSGGLLGFLLDRVLPPEPIPFVAAVQAPAAKPAPQASDAAVPAGPTTYNVYREIAPDAYELPVVRVRTPGTTALPMPINGNALAATSMTDELSLGRPRCYTVRAQRGTIMSEPSPRACFTPVDVFPPAAPVGVASVPSEGGISLIWEPNSELDLDGYLVLRREAGDATLRQLTPTPLAEARYRDTSVEPGKRYIYSVVAVDTQVPLPNISAESERVEETAR
jgi:hypothetical protein